MTAELTNLAVRITWDPYNDVNLGFYQVFRSDSPDGVYTMIELVDQSSPKTFLDSDVSPGQVYYYVVVASAVSGSFLAGSSEKKVTVVLVGSDVPIVHNNIIGPNLQNLQITFNSSESGPVSFKVFNINGTRVRNFFDGVVTANEEITVTWDLKNDNGQDVVNGYYLIQAILPKRKTMISVMVVR